MQKHDGEQNSKFSMQFNAPGVTNVLQSLPSGPVWSKKLFCLLLLTQLHTSCGGTTKDVTKPYFSTPTNVLGLESGVKKLALISGETCALTDDGRVYRWGVGFQTQEIGDNSTNKATQLPELSQITDLVGGENFCSLSTTGIILCWGDMPYLLPITAESSVRLVRFNREHSTCGFDANDKAYCLLDNHARRRTEDLYFFPFTLPGEKILELAGGSIEVERTGSFVALRPDGSAICAGVFGCGEAYPIFIGIERVPYASDTTPVVLQGLPKIRSVGYGCVVGVDGLVYCWGTNQYGELGTGEKGFFTPPMKPVKNVTRATRVAGDADHRCAVTDNGDLWCWGRNTYGQVGNAHTISDDCSPPRAASTPFTEYSCNGQYTPVKVLSGIKDVVVHAGGDGHGWTCALNVKGGVKCWGSNRGGKVGDGLPKAED